MKFSVVVVSALFCAVAVYATPMPGVPYSLPGVPYAAKSFDAKEVRELVRCVDGVFEELVEKYKELVKYHTEYKAIAMKTNLRLDKCEKIDDSEFKKQCVENIVTNSMQKLSEVIGKLKKENEELSFELAATASQKCGRK